MMAAAKPNKQYFHLMCLIVFICLVMCKSSSARRLRIAVTDTGGVVGSSAAAEVVEKARPCYAGGAEILGSQPGEENYKNSLTMEKPARLGGILGALVMNVLPRGPTPSSGPSRRNNGIQT